MADFVESMTSGKKPGRYCLEVRDLDAGYDGTPAVEGITFAIPPGQMVGVIGPNGAGKTTLFKAILGLIPHQRGEILLHEAPALGQRAMMGYLPQLEEINRDFPVSVADVVMMGRYPRIRWGRRPGPGDVAVMRQALERVDLLDQARTQIGKLSGGQQQRAFLARVLTQDPHLLLLDEPVSGVDATTQHAIFALLEELRNNGKTVVVATHDLNCVIERFDQVLCLNRRLIAYGPPKEVFRENILNQTYGHHLMVVRVGDRRIVVADEHRH
ncbi:MAG TPA: metal ABC transporter ATP-binding protein [Candidatus Methylomirabilis sp.]|nr:metal ABC transporter ATP-binding protein [Candidatus Methylomirabilis sp.]